MLRALGPCLALLTLLLAVPAAARAQGPDWRPPSREMPSMPTAAELRGDWLSARGAWFNGVERAAGVAPQSLRATGEARPGGDRLQLARFNSGALPVVVWSDRNGDGRCDMIDLYRSGGVIVQLIDADYDGSANVMRVYDASGALVRQERL